MVEHEVQTHSSMHAEGARVYLSSGVLLWWHHAGSGGEVGAQKMGSAKFEMNTILVIDAESSLSRLGARGGE